VGGGDAIVKSADARLEALAGWGDGGTEEKAMEQFLWYVAGAVALAVIGFVILKRKPRRRTDAKKLTAEERKRRRSNGWRKISTHLYEGRAAIEKERAMAPRNTAGARECRVSSARPLEKDRF
jgi:hypothetical protein